MRYDGCMSEYETIEKRITEARAVWIAEHGSAEGFYQAHKADMDRLVEIHDASIRISERRTRAVARETPRELHERSLIQLWLPMGQREAFRAKCMLDGKTMSARLRELISADIFDDEK